MQQVAEAQARGAAAPPVLFAALPRALYLLSF
jgi:hypothetical protein